MTNNIGILDRKSRKGRKNFRIIHEIFANPGISRVELCRKLELNKNNICTTINEMIDQGIVLAGDDRKSPLPGRRQIGLQLQPELFYIIGCLFSLDQPMIVLMDAQRNLLERCPLTNEGSEMSLRFLEEIRQKTNYLLQKVDRNRILGAGIALPGIINTLTGDVISSQAFRNRHFNLCEFFQEEFQLSSAIYNVAHIHAIAEKFFGAAQKMSNFIAIDEGLGAGMFFNGELYSGHQGNAGELGYMKISDNAKIGPDGRNGLLLDQSLFRLIGDKIIEVIKQGGQIKIDRSYQNMEYIPPHAIIKSIQEGNLFVAQLLSEVFSTIGDALLNVAYLLNPEAILLPYWCKDCPQYTIDVVKMKMGSYGLNNWMLKTEILASKSTPASYAEAVAILYTDHYLKKLNQNQ